ncbi:MAG: tetratricopeptide repeat protein [bacterium]
MNKQNRKAMDLTMYCAYCGKQIPNNARFCTGCGKEIQKEVHDPALPYMQPDRESQKNILVSKPTSGKPTGYPTIEHKKGLIMAWITAFFITIGIVNLLIGSNFWMQWIFYILGVLSITSCVLIYLKMKETMEKKAIYLIALMSCVGIGAMFGASMASGNVHKHKREMAFLEEYYKLGLESLKQKDILQADKEFRAVYKAKSDYKDTQARLAEIKSLRKEEAEKHINKTKEQLDQNNYPKAKEHFGLALKYDADVDRGGEIERKLKTKSIPFLYDDASKAFKDGDMISAKQYLYDILHIDPSYKDARYMYALVLGSSSDFEDAIKQLEKISKDNASYNKVRSKIREYEKNIELRKAEQRKLEKQRLKEAAHLELISRRWHVEYGHVFYEGQVRNISYKSLENVEAVVTFYDKDGNFITSSSALIEYKPLLVNQTSPFKVIETWNPAMKTASVEFKFLMGGTIPTYRE